ncbi:MAG: prepilin-type N-terminal cleavage/methylation domain-containing protein [Sulfurospirillum sp.]
MRRGLSLIELIFTIVIIAIVFTVIPKVVLSLNKSDKFAIRQDALFNGISLLQMISKLPWDENNTQSTDILHVSSGNFRCDDISKMRMGGFVGSRNCEENLSASSISNDAQSDYNLFNDIDDFNNLDINASYYALHVEVDYIDDNITYNGQKAVFALNSTPVSGTTNLKMVDVNISYQGKRGKIKHISGFNYVSSNIGQITLNKRVWK